LGKIETAKQYGSWTSLDSVEVLIMPEDLNLALIQDKIAFENYKNFSPTERKSYLYWLNQAKGQQPETIE